MATNHPEFSGVLPAIADGAKRDALIVDPWNCFGVAQVFAYTSELAALNPRRRLPAA